MADISAKLNQLVEWSPSGSGDSITFSEVSPSIRSGVQVDCSGFDLEDSVVTITTQAGSDKVVTIPEGTGSIGLVGEGFSIAAVKISGLSVGTYKVRFSQ